MPTGLSDSFLCTIAISNRFLAAVVCYSTKSVPTLRLSIQVNNDPGHIQDIKEELAMLLEKWGDVRLIDVREDQKTVPQQMRIDGA